MSETSTQAKPAPPRPKPYQVIVHVGSSTPTVEGVKVVDVSDTSLSVVEMLAQAELTPADLRSRVLFVAEDKPEFRDRALVAYAALVGFAKRRVDIAFDVEGESLQMDSFDAMMRRRPDAGRPAELVSHIQIGGPKRDDLPWLDITDGLSPQDASGVRWARRVRWCAPESLKLALPQLVAVAALRVRGGNDRFPFLTVGDEPAEVEDDYSSVVGVCLDAVRREAEQLRRDRRAGNRDAIAERVELTPRQQRLVKAGDLPVTEVLRRLGARSRLEMMDARADTPEAERGEQVEVEVWHCLHPENHTNGDATPSARVSPMRGDVEGFRCFRCLPERVDSLRLVMWARDCSVDEAADWLLQD